MRPVLNKARIKQDNRHDLDNELTYYECPGLVGADAKGPNAEDRPSEAGFTPPLPQMLHPTPQPSQAQKPPSQSKPKSDTTQLSKPIGAIGK